MNEAFKDFYKKVDDFLKDGKPKIAFGLIEPDKEILESLEKSKVYADITLVGPPAIKDVKGFNLVIHDNPEEKLATMLARDEIDGIIRGTIDDHATYQIYEKLTGEKCIFNPALLEDNLGHQFFISPAGNQEGWDKEERFNIAAGIAEFAKYWGINLNIAVFTGIRPGTYAKHKNERDGVIGIVNKTYEDAEWIVDKLTKKGYQAKNWSIELNTAIEAGCNFIVPVNGMVGNQIFRVVMFCGGKILFCPRAGFSRCYEDDSRTEKDYEFHVKFLVACIHNKKRGGRHF